MFSRAQRALTEAACEAARASPPNAVGQLALLLSLGVYVHDGSGQLATLGRLVHRVLHLHPHRHLFHDHPLLLTGTCLRPSGCAQLCRGLGGGAEIWQPARAQPAMSTWKTSGGCVVVLTETS